MVRRNYFYLQFLGLLGFVLVAPITRDYDLVDDRIVLALGAMMLLTAGALSLSGQGSRFRVALIIAALGMLSAAAVLVSENKLLPVLMALIMVTFVSFTGVYAIRDVMLRGLVGANELVGAICIYINIGVFWAILYFLLEQIAPGSFRNLLEPEPQLLEFIYVSFVTLTTLGYGDVVPVSGTVRTLTYTEACVGQFYIAVLVAGLVGTRLARITPVKEAPQSEAASGAG